MDKTIEKLFQEKNSEILRNKLLLDIGNNDDSLRLTTKNKVTLATAIIIRKINNFFRDNEIEYDVKTLTEMLNRYGDIIIELVYEMLNNRKEFLSNDISNHNKTSFDELLESISNFMEGFVSEFEAKLDAVVHGTMREGIFEEYTFKMESQKEELIMVLERYDSDLFQSIVGAISERNTSLLNMFKETNDKVLELETKTTGKIIEKK